MGDNGSAAAAHGFAVTTVGTISSTPSGSGSSGFSGGSSGGGGAEEEVGLGELPGWAGRPEIRSTRPGSGRLGGGHRLDQLADAAFDVAQNDTSRLRVTPLGRRT